MPALLESHLPNRTPRRGKVRDVYDLGERLLIVASDRLSAFDVVLPTGIPEKGMILTRLSNFWFDFFTRKFGSHFQHHLLATRVEDFPKELQHHREQLQGRSVLVKKTRVIPIECVVRGYIAGGGWKEYQRTGGVCGVALPAGLRQCERLAAPIFTPTTKAEQGHDESISFDAAAAKVGRALMEQVREKSLALYTAAAEYAAGAGILIADTKFEWGLGEGAVEPILIDEALTPDSSRFWPAAGYAPGRDQPSYDKQYVRNYLETLPWNKQPPGPELPAEVIARTREKYIEAFERLTGSPWGSQSMTG